MFSWTGGGSGVNRRNLLISSVVFFWTVNATTTTQSNEFTEEVTKKSGKMFNLYSSMNRRNGTEVEEKKEIQTTGHDRFYQHERSR